MHSFSKRNRVKKINLYGQAASVNDNSMRDWIGDNVDLLLKCEQRNVYNADETSLFPGQVFHSSYVKDSINNQALPAINTG